MNKHMVREKDNNKNRHYNETFDNPEEDIKIGDNFIRKVENARNVEIGRSSVGINIVNAEKVRIGSDCTNITVENAKDVSIGSDCTDVTVMNADNVYIGGEAYAVHINSDLNILYLSTDIRANIKSAETVYGSLNRNNIRIGEVNTTKKKQINKPDPIESTKTLRIRNKEHRNQR